MSPSTNETPAWIPQSVQTSPEPATAPRRADEAAQPGAERADDDLPRSSADRTRTGTGPTGRLEILRSPCRRGYGPARGIARMKIPYGVSNFAELRTEGY